MDHENFPYLCFKKYKDRGQEDEARLFVKVLAQIVREGITYKIREDQFGWEIVITGGY